MNSMYMGFAGFFRPYLRSNLILNRIFRFAADSVSCSCAHA